MGRVRCTGGNPPVQWAGLLCAGQDQRASSARRTGRVAMAADGHADVLDRPGQPCGRARTPGKPAPTPGLKPSLMTVATSRWVGWVADGAYLPAPVTIAR